MPRNPLLRILPALLALGALAAEEAVPATARVPLAVLGVAAGDEVSVDGAAAPADAAGVALPLAKPAQVEWTARGAKAAHRIVAVAAGTADQAPPWAKDPPKTEADGTLVVVGFAESATVSMAMQRALMDARTQAMQQAGSVTTAVVEADGSRTVRTQSSGMVRSETRDIAIVVSADPQAVKPAACWVRIAARVEKAPPLSPEQLKSKMDADKAFNDLNKKIDEEIKKPADPPKP